MDELPNEIISKILDYSEPSECYKLTSLNKRFHKLRSKSLCKSLKRNLEKNLFEKGLALNDIFPESRQYPYRIAGSLMVKTLTSLPFKTNDIDIFYSNFYTVPDHFDKDYTESPIIQDQPFHEDYINFVPTNLINLNPEEYNNLGKRYIIDTYNYNSYYIKCLVISIHSKYSDCIIDLIRDHEDFTYAGACGYYDRDFAVTDPNDKYRPRESLIIHHDFDLEICKSYFDGLNWVIFNPMASFDNKSVIINFKYTKNAARLNKYMNRGIQFLNSCSEIISKIDTDYSLTTYNCRNRSCKDCYPDCDCKSRIECNVCMHQYYDYLYHIYFSNCDIHKIKNIRARYLNDNCERQRFDDLCYYFNGSSYDDLPDDTDTDADAKYPPDLEKIHNTLINYRAF